MCDPEAVVAMYMATSWNVERAREELVPHAVRLHQAIYRKPEVTLNSSEMSSEEIDLFNVHRSTG